MKILVLPGWYPGPLHPFAGDFIMYQVQNLKKVKIDVSVIFADLGVNHLNPFSFSKISFANEEGVPTFRRTGFFLPKRTSFLLKWWARQYGILYQKYQQQHGRPDLIHAHIFQGGFAANYLSKKHQIPYIVTEHSSSILKKDQPQWRKELMNEVYDSAKKVIAVGSALKRKLEQDYTKKEVLILPNSVNTELFTPGKINKQEPFTLIGIGSLIPSKGFDLLIKAFANCQKKWPGLKLIIVGEGKEKRRLSQLARELEITSGIRFTGQCSQEQVAELLKQAHVLVHPSHFETFGIVVIEALATGIPVIATACGGPQDILTSSLLGALVPPHNQQALEEAIQSVLKNYANFNKTAIRQYVLENYSNEVVIERLIQIYIGILGNIT